jgi:transposase
MPAADETYTVGVDWGTQTHHVCVVDAAGRVVAEEEVAHTGEALGQWVTQLLGRVADLPARLAVALEVPRGPVVELLLARGIPTFSLNPKQATRFRERSSVAGAKDDRRDAHALAQALRTDRALFRALAVEDPRVVQLREWSRMDAELTGETNRLTSRLREQWQRYYPQLLALAPAADEPWVWALFKRAPVPATGARLKRTTIATVLGDYRIRRVDVPTVLATLRTPALVVAAGTAEAAGAHARLLIARLWVVREQQQECRAQLAALLDALDDPPPPATGGPPPGPTDVRILRSMPGIGPGVAARLLSEAAAPLAQRARSVLRAWTGLAPVTQQSGKTRRVSMRTACSGALRDACFYWALAAMRVDQPSKAYYARLRAKGHPHGRALRSVADRLLRILCAMLTTRTLYDATHFTPGRLGHAPSAA